MSIQLHRVNTVTESWRVSLEAEVQGKLVMFENLSSSVDVVSNSDRKCV
jgi:hypothetical protein